MKKVLKNLFYIFTPLILGSIVGFLISDSIDYQNLIKPPLAPPKIVFPIAWSIIYLLLGISYKLFKDKSYDEYGDKLYYIGLAVNLLWSIIFFVFKWRFFAILWIILLDIFVIYTIKLFKKYNKTTLYLLLPYLLWSLYATYLTIGIFILN